MKMWVDRDRNSVVVFRKLGSDRTRMLNFYRCEPTHPEQRVGFRFMRSPQAFVDTFNLTRLLPDLLQANV